MTTPRFTNEDLARRQDEMHQEIVGMRSDFKEFYKANLTGRVHRLEDNWKWLSRSVVGVVISLVVGSVLAFTFHPVPLFGNITSNQPTATTTVPRP